MAATKTAPVARKTRAKTPAQKAKAEANIRAAQERLRKLQQQQAMVNNLRKMGYVGSDPSLLRIAEKRATEVAARQFVEAAITGPYGERVLRFLGDRKGTPAQLAEVVRNYCTTQGWKLSI
jgi:tRNA A37 methylthiotransferase MiaB